MRGLGVTLWELLTRRRLFAEAEDERQLAALVHDHDVPRLRTIDPGLDRDLEAIVARATERRAADRIATAGQLAEYLQLYLDGKPLPIRPPTTAEMVGRWVRDHKALVGSAAAAILAIVATVVIAFVLITRSRGTRQSRQSTRLSSSPGPTLSWHRETRGSPRPKSVEGSSPRSDWRACTSNGVRPCVPKGKSIMVCSGWHPA